MPMDKNSSDTERGGQVYRVKLWGWVGSYIPASLLGVILVSSCASKPDPRRQVEEAFRAGHQQALQELYESKFPIVTVLGPVRNPKLDWTKELTLARAIVKAEYHGVGDPREIILRRGNETAHIAPKELLAGNDWDLQPGDSIEIVP